jgi:hypothetical protein
MKELADMGFSPYKNKMLPQTGELEGQHERLAALYLPDCFPAGIGTMSRVTLLVAEASSGRSLRLSG